MKELIDEMEVQLAKRKSALETRDKQNETTARALQAERDEADILRNLVIQQEQAISLLRQNMVRVAAPLDGLPSGHMEPGWEFDPPDRRPTDHMGLGWLTK